MPWQLAMCNVDGLDGLIDRARWPHRLGSMPWQCRWAQCPSNVDGLNALIQVGRMYTVIYIIYISDLDLESAFWIRYRKIIYEIQVKFSITYPECCF
jgi:hypothetical protein